MKFDEIDDDAVYVIELLGLSIKGRLLKPRNAQAMILDEILRKKERIDYERRCYPNTQDIQVYKEFDNPSIYTIYSSVSSQKI